MSMTRKHFEAIAQLMRYAKRDAVVSDYYRGWEECRYIMAKGMAEICQEDSPNFNWKRFIEACEIEE